MPYGRGKWGVFKWGIAQSLEKGPYISLDQDGEYIVTSSAQLQRERAPITRALFRLKCRHGKFVYDSGMGNKCWNIQSLAEGERKAEQYIKDALQPILDDGEISEVVVGNVEINNDTGALAVDVKIKVDDELVSLGLIRIGA